ncbi:hypothetical protein ACPX19_13910 [Winogradskyella sp. HB-48]|uniref:hypothetical protein n=1 Tax=Winogradskyella sp. HB-48 TaxID=3416808 RepID=UPI003CE811B2
MNRSLVLILMSFCFSFSLAQKNITESLLVVDSLWTKEMFEFPIHFAPDITYQGFEEARFPKGWSNQDSSEYWSYVFAWSIKGNTVLNENILEVNLQLYFDGLMATVNKDQNFKVPETVALFIKNDENNFIGKIRLFNSFHTKKMMTLNVLVNTYNCLEEDRVLVLFRFSPSVFDAEIWEKLKDIKLKTNACAINNKGN